MAIYLISKEQMSRSGNLLRTAVDLVVENRQLVFPAGMDRKTNKQ